MPVMRVGITPSSFAESDPTPLKILIASGVEVIENPYRRRLTESEAFNFVLDKDGLIAGLEPLNIKVLQNALKLKAIARVGIGVDNIDLNAARELNIKVSNTPDGPTNSVAEMTVTAALNLCRNLLETNTKLHQGQWIKTIGKGLQGLKVLFVGYGRIGRRTAELMLPFGAKIIIVDPCIEEKNLEPGGCLMNLEEGLHGADIITLHASGDETIIGEEQFRQMKDGVILLNSARGTLVDENALINAIESGKVAGAWFDAFWDEPYNGPLLKYDNVLLTPHISTYTEQCRLSMEMDAVTNLLKDLGLNK
jgi:D-3-phosphoglycerate dehydrogenase